MIDKGVTVSELNQSVAFTGYRSHKLPFGRNLNDPIAIALRNALYKEYERLIVDHGFRFFLTGGAEGSDLMAAEVILELKKEYKFHHLGHFLCLPCINHDKKWCREDRLRLEAIKDRSHIIYVSNEEYTPGCMQERNKYMVDTACVLLSVFDGKKGGTNNTIEYARKCARKIITFRPANPILRVEEFVDPKDFNWYGMKLEDPKGVYMVDKFNTDKNFNKNPNKNLNKNLNNNPYNNPYINPNNNPDKDDQK